MRSQRRLDARRCERRTHPPECEAPKCLVLPCAAACAPCPPRASPALARRTDSTSPSGRVRAANPIDVAPARFIAEAEGFTVRSVPSPAYAYTARHAHRSRSPVAWRFAQRVGVRNPVGARGRREFNGCLGVLDVHWCARWPYCFGGCRRGPVAMWALGFEEAADPLEDPLGADAVRCGRHLPAKSSDPTAISLSHAAWYFRSRSSHRAACDRLCLLAHRDGSLHGVFVGTQRAMHARVWKSCRAPTR